MATTKDRLDELTRRKRELEDHDVVALEDGRVADAEVPPAAAGNEPAVAVLRTSLRERLLEPLSGRWAAIGAVAWVALLGIGIAVEPQPTNPNVVDPWFLNVLGTFLVAAVVAAFAGFWRRQRWSLAASLLASGLLVVSTVACPASGHHTQLGAWWVVQLGCGLGLVTTSALGLRRG
jgi:peptidoglycan/LPS O-acetylase OafA/YrhL